MGKGILLLILLSILFAALAQISSGYVLLTSLFVVFSIVTIFLLIVVIAERIDVIEFLKDKKSE